MTVIYGKSRDEFELVSLSRFWSAFVLFVSVFLLLAEARFGFAGQRALAHVPFENKVFQGITFVYIPPGSYRRERPPAFVTITKGFWLSKFEITQKQWKETMGYNTSHYRGLERPVETVSKNECRVFTTLLTLRNPGTYRLPTEAEWEYASLGGETVSVATKNVARRARLNNVPARPRSWLGGIRSIEGTIKVGSLEANPWGLHDMYGNVAEFCLDDHGQLEAGDLTDPLFKDNPGKITARGGSYDTKEVWLVVSGRGAGFDTSCRCRTMNILARGGITGHFVWDHPSREGGHCDEATDTRAHGLQRQG